MKFDKIIPKKNEDGTPGKLSDADEKAVKESSLLISDVLAELALRYDSKLGSGIGGDPLVFTLITGAEHIADFNLSTAATDGKRFFWNPHFVLQFGKIGIRIIANHEAWHAIYMHPKRRGFKLPWLWNIAVDYIVNGATVEDLTNRGLKGDETFKTNLGKYITLKECAEKMSSPPEDPHKSAKGKKKSKDEMRYFMDPNLQKDWKRPEFVYEFLLRQIPKCPECGRLGHYNQKQKQQGQGQQPGQQPGQKGKGKGDKGQGKGKGKGEKGDKGQGNQPGQGQGDPSNQHDHGDGSPCDCDNHQGNGQGNPQDQQDQSQSQGNQQGQGCGKGGCDTCGKGQGDSMEGYPGMFGDLLDDHIDADINEEELAKKITDAMELAKKMAGKIPGALEDELGQILAPKMTWQDFIRNKITKIKQGNGKNDWTNFKRKPIFAGLLVPKRKDYFVRFGCLLDTSGSMSKEDMAYGISQLQCLDSRAERNCSTSRRDSLF